MGQHGKRIVLGHDGLKSKVDAKMQDVAAVV